MAGIGLNVFQVIQNELISREGNRSTLGLGFRLAILEERILNAEAISRNGKIWKLHHAVTPVTSLIPAARERGKAHESMLLSRKGAKKDKDDKDPAMNPRSEEKWEVHAGFPRTLAEFKELQFYPERVRSLLEFYDIKVYRPDFRLLDIGIENRAKDVTAYMETCMEELAMHWC